MSYIVDLDITHGEETALPAPFQKVLDEAGQTVNFQPMTDQGGGQQPIYLWCASEPYSIADTAILEVRVLEGEQVEVPAGFKKVQRDLSAGATSVKSYLCFRVGAPSTAEKPLAGVALLAPGQDVPVTFFIFGFFYFNFSFA